MKKLNEHHFNQFLSWIFDPSFSCTEFLVWNAGISRSNHLEKAVKYPKVIGGWYDRLDCLRFDVSRLNDVSGYLSLNPINKEMMARENSNCARMIRRNEGTKETNILCYRHFLIDIDCHRLDGVSATDAELATTIEIRDRILEDHPKIRECALWGCSGNGAYIVVRLPDYPVGKTTKNTIKSVLHSLADKYGKVKRDKAFIDTNTFSPITHIGIPGTYKCKGTYTEERPWRLITVDGSADVHNTNGFTH